MKERGGRSVGGFLWVNSSKVTHFVGQEIISHHRGQRKTLMKRHFTKDCQLVPQLSQKVRRVMSPLGPRLACSTHLCWKTNLWYKMFGCVRRCLYGRTNRTTAISPGGCKVKRRLDLVQKQNAIKHTYECFWFAQNMCTIL